jgi:hypothetical protein
MRRMQTTMSIPGHTSLLQLRTKNSKSKVIDQLAKRDLDNRLTPWPEAL